MVIGLIADVLADAEACTTDARERLRHCGRANVAIVKAIRNDHNPELDVEAAGATCWATIHSLVTLAGKLEMIATKFGHQPVDGFTNR